MANTVQLGRHSRKSPLNARRGREKKSVTSELLKVITLGCHS
jgi:hypothetical protein